MNTYVPAALDPAQRAMLAGMLDDDDQQTWRCYRDPS